MTEKIMIRPELNEKTIEYIKSLGDQTGDITKEQVQEFVKYAMQDATQDRATFASFIAYIDACQRKSPIFKRATAIHGKAALSKTMSDENYKSYFNELSNDHSELKTFVLQHLSWSNNHREELKEILGEGSCGV